MVARPATPSVRDEVRLPRDFVLWQRDQESEGLEIEIGGDGAARPAAPATVGLAPVGEFLGT